MNTRINTLLIIIGAVVGIIFSFWVYIIATKANLYSQAFITTCGQMLQNIPEYIRFDLDGAATSIVLFFAAIGVSLAAIRTIQFVISHRYLSSQDRYISTFPQKLNWVIHKHGIQKTTIAVVGGDTLSAYTIGLLKPKIIISEALIKKASRQQLEAVILHEVCHVQNHHVLWLLFARIASSSIFFIPFIGYLVQQLKTEFELAADSFVLKNQKTHEYLRGSLALNLQYVGEIIPHFATAPIEARVEFLTTHKISFDKINKWQLALSLLGTAFIMGLALMRPNTIAATYNPTSNAICLMGSGCVTTDCINHINKEQNYYLSTIDRG